MAFWDGQAGAFKGKGSAGGGRHARHRRGRSAYGVGRSGRIEGEVGRRGVLWQATYQMTTAGGQVVEVSELRGDRIPP